MGVLVGGEGRKTTPEGCGWGRRLWPPGGPISTPHYTFNSLTCAPCTPPTAAPAPGAAPRARRGRRGRGRGPSAPGSGGPGVGRPWEGGRQREVGRGEPGAACARSRVGRARRGLGRAAARPLWGCAGVAARGFRGRRKSYERRFRLGRRKRGRPGGGEGFLPGAARTLALRCAADVVCVVFYHRRRIYLRLRVAFHTHTNSDHRPRLTTPLPRRLPNDTRSRSPASASAALLSSPPLSRYLPTHPLTPSAAARSARETPCTSTA